MGKEKNAALSANNNATYKVVNGVTYFKLKSEFDGDYTKNCGLLGSDIDENFYFLRGYDIKEVTLDDAGILTIRRVDDDYEPIEIDLGETIRNHRPNIALNEDGSLVIDYEDGTEPIVVDGFLIEGSENLKIATDSTLRGKGTTYKPLGISPVEKTGTYAPASRYFDRVDSFGRENIMDGITPNGKGDRVVVKAMIPDYGYLYNYRDVEEISEYLDSEGKGWRIPTKEDWDELLNALECEEDRNHTSLAQDFLGKQAGTGLKSAGIYGDSEKPGMWNMANKVVPQSMASELTPEDVVGQDVVGFTALPLGYRGDRNVYINDPDNQDIEGFRKATAFWSTTKDSRSGQIYGKILSYNTSTVAQSLFPKESLLSIRLVKDYNIDDPDFTYDAYEDILGWNFPTKLITSPFSDVKYAKVWTTTNFYVNPGSCEGKVSTQWGDEENFGHTAYLICEYDGKEWVKKQMREGDSIVILNKDGEEDYHEYRIIHGELVDTLQQTYDAFEGDFNEIREQISGAVETVESLSAAVETVVENMETMSSAVTADLEKLSDDIDSLSAATEELTADVESVSAATEEEVARAMAAESGLSEEISSEIERALGVESGLSSAISSETERALAAESGLSADISAENERAVSKETELENADIKPQDYNFTQDGVELVTKGNENPNVKINLDPNFFNFGLILNDGE